MSLLGSMVEDTVTGFRGRATARCEYESGVVLLRVEPRGIDTTGKLLEARWVEEQRCEKLAQSWVMPERVES